MSPYSKPAVSMALSQVLRGIPVRAQQGPDVPVGQVTDDSRLLASGDLFVAVAGRTVDGHDFVAQAAQAGAAAVLVSRPVAFPGTWVQVDDPAWALGVASANRAGHPARHLARVALTGTNGKTTTTYLLEAILEASGARPGIIGTVSYRYGGKEKKAPFTTPTAPALQSLLSEMVLAGCTHVVMEVSSHALEMQRVAGMDFQVAGFTNFTQDHLDLHGSMEAYRDAKRRLFTRHLEPEGAAVLWAEDPAAEVMVSGYPGRVVRVGTRPGWEVTIEPEELTLEGLRARIHLRSAPLKIRSSLVGEHNLGNIALAAAIAAELGVEPAAIADGVAQLEAVPGRLERVGQEADVPVLVDYAHTPDALSHALAALRPLTAGRLLCVFGCGGDRDTLKRPLMGRTVAEGADLAMITSDNPRTEDPLAIIAQILEGVAPVGLRRVNPEDLETASRGYSVLPDRRAAIHAAVAAASPEDVVLIAGKGHEDYQILGARRIHFDDREEGRAALTARRGV